MEEFTQKKDAADDDVILDASTKVIIDPLHREDQIQGEQSSSEIASAHANGAAIGNFDGDRESTGETAPSPSVEQRADALLAAHKATAPAAAHTKFPTYLVVVVAMIALILFVLLYR